MKNAVVLNEVKLAFVRSAATLLLFFPDWWSEATGCFCYAFVERSDLFTDHSVLWSETTGCFCFWFGFELVLFSVLNHEERSCSFKVLYCVFFSLPRRGVESYDVNYYLLVNSIRIGHDF